MLTKKSKSVVSLAGLNAKPLMAFAGVALCVVAGVTSALKLDHLSREALASRNNQAIESIVSAVPFEQPGVVVVGSGALSDAPRWQRNAATFPANDRAPRMAVIVVDSGWGMAPALKALQIPAPLTFAIAPTADSASKTALAARKAGRETLLLLPMQSENRFDTSPNPIAINTPENELMRRLNWNFSQIDGYVGVMNQFGEAVTRDAPTMRAVLEIIQSKGLSFIDTRAHSESIASAVARRMGIPAGDRNISVQPGANAEELRAELTQALRHAEKWGTAIITVPAEHRIVKALEAWTATLKSDVKIAPVSAVIKRLRSGRG